MYIRYLVQRTVKTSFTATKNCLEIMIFCNYRLPDTVIYNLQHRSRRMELTEQEQQLYEELFQRCDLAKSTKIPVVVAGELFSSSGLPAEVSLKVCFSLDTADCE